MQNTAPLFPGFHLKTLRRKPRAASRKLSGEIAKLKQKSFSKLGECFRNFIPSQYLRPSETGALSHRRSFSKENTFWAFFSQVLGDDGGCQEVIRKLQAFAAIKSKPLPSRRQLRPTARHAANWTCQGLRRYFSRPLIGC